MWSGLSREAGRRYDGGVIAVNFKTYSEAAGERAINLAKWCAEVALETGVRIVAIPQLGDLNECVRTGAECWVQHVDFQEAGKHTGFVTIEDVKMEGAKGTLLNHSEHRLVKDDLVKTMERIRTVGQFEVCICAENPEEVEEMAKLNPNFVAYEPPELIGSRDKSVATEKPESIKKAVESSHCALLIGAGVHSVQDVEVGLQLGAKGILLATDIVLSEDPKAELRKLAEAFK
jgi:triosephosphate isomerase (TIM)